MFRKKENEIEKIIKKILLNIKHIYFLIIEMNEQFLLNIHKFIVNIFLISTIKCR